MASDLGGTFMIIAFDIKTPQVEAPVGGPLTKWGLHQWITCLRSYRWWVISGEHPPCVFAPPLRPQPVLFHWGDSGAGLGAYEPGATRGLPYTWKAPGGIKRAAVCWGISWDSSQMAAGCLVSKPQDPKAGRQGTTQEHAQLDQEQRLGWTQNPSPWASGPWPDSPHSPRVAGPHQPSPLPQTRQNPSEYGLKKQFQEMTFFLWS